MTQPSSDSSPRTLPGAEPPGVSTGLTPPAAPALRAEHAQERWTRWTTTRDRDSQSSRRRFYFIAGIIGVGLLVWLFWTL